MKRAIGYGALALLALLVITFVVTGGSVATYAFWAPKQANAERNVFEHSASYIQGKITTLGKLRFQYQQAESGPGKDALRLLIINEASTVKEDDLPADLAAFLRSVR